MDERESEGGIRRVPSLFETGKRKGRVEGLEGEGLLRKENRGPEITKGHAAMELEV